MQQIICLFFYNLGASLNSVKFYQRPLRILDESCEVVVSILLLGRRWRGDRLALTHLRVLLVGLLELEHLFESDGSFLWRLVCCYLVEPVQDASLHGLYFVFIVKDGMEAGHKTTSIV